MSHRTQYIEDRRKAIKTRTESGTDKGGQWYKVTFIQKHATIRWMYRLRTDTLTRHISDYTNLKFAGGIRREAIEGADRSFHDIEMSEVRDLFQLAKRLSFDELAEESE